MPRVNGLQPGDRVLDLGCRTGRHRIPLAPDRMVLSALDPDEYEIMEIAEKQ